MRQQERRKKTKDTTRIVIAMPHIDLRWLQWVFFGQQDSTVVDPTLKVRIWRASQSEMPIKQIVFAWLGGILV